MVFVEDIQNVSSDLLTAQLVDISTYTTPARNTLALYNYLYKRAADNTDVAIVLDNTTPLTVTAWNFALPAQDGNFVYITFGFPIWSAGTYTLGNCVYYSGSYYTVNAASTSQTPTGGNWTLITDILGTVLNLANSNVIITQGYAFSTAIAEAGPIGDAMAAFGPKFIDGKCQNINQAGASMYGAGLVESAWMNFRRQDYVQAQNIMDFLNQQFAQIAA